MIRFLIIFFLIFAPVIRPIGNWFDISFFFALLIILLNNKSILNKIIFPNYLKVLLLHFLLAVFSLYLIIDYNNFTTDQIILVLFKPFKIIIIALASFHILINFKNYFPNNYSQHILKYIYLSIFLHGLIMIFQFYNPSFRDYIYYYTTDLNFRSSFDYNFRMGGLSGGTGGAVLSVVQSIGLIILPFINIKFNKFLKIFSFLIILISIFLCGRSGLWVLIIFFPISLILSSSSYLSFFKSGFVVIFLSLFTFSLLIKELRNNDNESLNPLQRTFDSFVKYDSRNGFQDETINFLIKGFVFPSDIKILLFGDGDSLFNNQFNRNLDSDTGYIRNIWSFGIFISIIYWFPIFYYFFLFWSNKNKNIESKLFLILLFIMIIFHLKESFFYVRMFWPILTLILGSIYFQNQEHVLHR